MFEFDKFISEFMEDKGYTGAQLARKLGVHPSDVTHWKKGNRVPGDDVLKWIETRQKLPQAFLRLQKRLNRLEVEGFSMIQLTDPDLLKARGITITSAADRDLTPDQREAAGYVMKNDYVGLTEWALSRIQTP